MASFLRYFGIFLFLLAFQWKVVLGASVSQKSLSKHKVVVVVSFDGFRYDYLDKVSMPTLRQIQKEGVSVPFMQPQFPTKTFPNHHSIATGLYPDVHGVIDNELYDPLLKKKLSGYKNDQEFWFFHPDIAPIWVRNEQAGDGRYSGCYMWAGSASGYGEKQNLFPTHYIPKYDSSVPWEERVDTVISWITDPTKPANMVFLYHNEPDSKGHAFGADDPEILEEAKKVDIRVAHLVMRLQEEGIYDKINLVILSDHGMETVRKENAVNATAIVNPDLYYVTGGSPVLNIQPKRVEDTEAIYKAFKNVSGKGEKFQVFKKAELAGMQKLNYGKNRRVRDIVLLAQPGFGFDDIIFNDRGVYGVHGYDNSHVNMSAIFMARGPAFKEHYRHTSSIRNIDLFSLFSNIAGIPVSPNNGSFESVSVFLKSSGNCGPSGQWGLLGPLGICFTLITNILQI